MTLDPRELPEALQDPLALRRDEFQRSERLRFLVRMLRMVGLVSFLFLTLGLAGHALGDRIGEILAENTHQ